MTKSQEITFERATLDHKDAIFEWLVQPHVREFWDNSPEHGQDILIFMDGRKQKSPYFNGIFDYWVGCIQGEPYALILTAEVKSDSETPEEWIPHLSTTGKTYSLDFMIGNKKYLGKGLGALTLERFTQFYRQEIDPKIDTFIIDPAEGNPRAMHVYSKAGFKIVTEYTPKEGHFEGIKHYFMVKRVSPDARVI